MAAGRTGTRALSPAWLPPATATLLLVLGLPTARRLPAVLPKRHLRPQATLHATRTRQAKTSPAYASRCRRKRCCRAAQARRVRSGGSVSGTRPAACAGVPCSVHVCLRSTACSSPLCLWTKMCTFPLVTYLLAKTNPEIVHTSSLSPARRRHPQGVGPAQVQGPPAPDRRPVLQLQHDASECRVPVLTPSHQPALLLRRCCWCCRCGRCSCCCRFLPAADACPLTSLPARRSPAALCSAATAQTRSTL